jgi:hypothetical protein
MGHISRIVNKCPCDYDPRRGCTDYFIIAESSVGGVNLNNVTSVFHAVSCIFPTKHSSKLTIDFFMKTTTVSTLSTTLCTAPNIEKQWTLNGVWLMTKGRMKLSSNKYKRFYSFHLGLSGNMMSVFVKGQIFCGHISGHSAFSS